MTAEELLGEETLSGAEGDYLGGEDEVGAEKEEEEREETVVEDAGGRPGHGGGRLHGVPSFGEHNNSLVSGDAR